MPFPAPHTPWPMPEWEPVRTMVETAAMWWEGDVNQLSSKYHGQYKPSQYSGGIVGSVSRWFWGNPDMKQDRRVHMPLAADICATSATLLFDRPPRFAHPDENAQNHLDELLNPDEFPAQLLVAAESCAALGGVGWRIQWDTDIDQHPWIEWVDADACWPTFAYGKLQSVMFMEELTPINNMTYRLFTEHTRGRIEYRLMEGKPNDTGRIVPLTQHPTTAGLANQVDEDSGQNTDMTVLAAGYIPNARPVVGFRKHGQLRNIGRSDLTPDLYPMFDALDEVWTEIRAEIRLSRKKIIVPDWMLETHALGAGQSFDNDREVFSPVRGHPNAEMKPEIYAPTLRIDAMIDAATAWTDKIIQRANYSPASFGLDTASTGGNPTAREIEARYDASMKTWSAKSAYWRAGLKAAATALIQRDNIMHGKPLNIDPPRIEMDKPVQETAQDRATTIQALDAARSASIETKVKMQWPDWDQDMQDQEVERIKIEQAGAYDPQLFAQPDDQLAL